MIICFHTQNMRKKIHKNVIKNKYQKYRVNTLVTRLEFIYRVLFTRHQSRRTWNRENRPRRGCVKDPVTRSVVFSQTVSCECGSTPVHIRGERLYTSDLNEPDEYSC